jgi:peroxiredoxin
VEEVPLLVAAKQQLTTSRPEIVGIAVDNAYNIIEFARTYKINYPLLVGGATALGIARALGECRRGIAVHRDAELRQVLASLLG